GGFAAGEDGGRETGAYRRKVSPSVTAYAATAPSSEGAKSDISLRDAIYGFAVRYISALRKCDMLTV
ncbi:MAG: hypothetical protein IIW14_08635, partial [Kiritimatiellae bacterium]|nr:hypothetical protein [Kiritimatiellia bacterium]